VPAVRRESAALPTTIASDEYLREEVRTQFEILRMRREQYTRGADSRRSRRTDRHHRRRRDCHRVVDASAIRSVRTRKPKKVAVAIAVWPPSSLVGIESEADEVVCLYTSKDFFAVGQFFEDFSEVTDDMVVAALARPQIATAQQPV
jgi:putative phosphoribosyl transferase